MGLHKIIESLECHRSFLVTTHMNPEGDALGSALGLALALRDMKKEALVYNVDAVPRFLDFLPHQNLYFRKKEVDRPFDAMIVLDCGDFERTGLEPNSAALPSVILNIDHHVTNKKFGSVNWIEPDATATGEMVYDLLTVLEKPITRKIALSLYTALFTETGSFRYSNTTPKALRIAAALLEKGIEPYWLSKKLYESRCLNGLKLLGEVLTRIEQSPDGKISWIVLSQDLLEKTQSEMEDSEDFVNFPRSVQGVEVAVFFRELGDRSYKVSFRSKGQVDVAKLAETLGGGGHRYASGCRMTGPLSRVQRKVLDAVAGALAPH